MASQPSLFERPPKLVPRRRPFKVTNAELAAEWMRNNPKVLGLFLEFARTVKREGRAHYGIKAIAERVRWEVQFSWKEEFKLNNNHFSFIARELVRLDPSLSELFSFRKVKS